MSLAEWLDDVVADEDEPAGWDTPRKSSRRRDAGGDPYYDDVGRRLDYLSDRIEELSDRDGDDEVGEVAEAVALLARRVQENRARSGDILEQIMDRLDRVESVRTPRSRRDRGGAGDDLYALTRLTDALAAEIDHSDAASRATIDALRDRAGRLRRAGGGGDRMDAVLTAIRDLDDRIGEIERGGSGTSRDDDS
ncbi:MAG: hypothetical protein KDJ16_16220, partial [Hyphomicrobiales bacterium]|nr:hypothetical protein [Hyphomicrobiales bacterium]